MDWFVIKEFFRETSLDVASFIFLFGVFYIMFSLLRVMLYEIKIERIETQKQKEIDTIKSGTKGKDVTTVFMERQIKAAVEKYQYGLEHLNRKRKFILERLPFFKN